jgi:hypothetical protein
MRRVRQMIVAKRQLQMDAAATGIDEAHTHRPVEPLDPQFQRWLSIYVAISRGSRFDIARANLATAASADFPPDNVV